MAKDAKDSFGVNSTTKDRIPRLAFFDMKQATLGKDYCLSLVFVGDKRSQSLNKAYRGKSYIPNVLSFPLDKKHGEIFLNLKQAKREHKARGESYEFFVALLVIHGMYHLKGMLHGSTMEEHEARLLAKLKIRNTFS